MRRAEPESLVGLFAEAPVTASTKPERQVTHWLFALGDTLAINALRCLALLASHDQRAQVLEEVAMLIWHRAPVRPARAARGVPAGGDASVADHPDALARGRPGRRVGRRHGGRGTQILIVNSFNHRDRDAVEFADQFAPEQWISGAAADDWSFNHFSHGPQGCPGAGLALLVGKAILATVLRDREPKLISPTLDSAKPLPHSLDYFSLRFELAPAA